MPLGRPELLTAEHGRADDGPAHGLHIVAPLGAAQHAGCQATASPNTCMGVLHDWRALKARFLCRCTKAHLEGIGGASVESHTNITGSSGLLRSIARTCGVPKEQKGAASPCDASYKMSTLLNAMSIEQRNTVEDPLLARRHALAQL